MPTDARSPCSCSQASALRHASDPHDVHGAVELGEQRSQLRGRPPNGVEEELTLRLADRVERPAAPQEPGGGTRLRADAEPTAADVVPTVVGERRVEAEGDEASTAESVATASG